MTTTSSSDSGGAGAQRGRRADRDDGLLTALVRQVLQTDLEVEMTDHLAPNLTPPGPSAPQLELCAGDGAQGLTPVGWPDRECGLAVRQGHDYR